MIFCISRHIPFATIACLLAWLTKVDIFDIGG